MKGGQHELQGRTSEKHSRGQSRQMTITTQRTTANSPAQAARTESGGRRSRRAGAAQWTQPGSQLRELRGRPRHGPVAAPAMRPSGGHPAKAARRDSRRRGPPSAAEAAVARRLRRGTTA